LALLYALGSDFLADEKSSVWKEFWPEYASTLAIELVRIDGEKNKENNDNSNNSNSNDNKEKKSQEAQHVIRVLMNGRVVTSTDFLFQKFERDKERKNGSFQSSSSSSATSPPPNMLGQGPYDLLTTKDFWDIVTRLESQGEYDFSLWPTMKDDDNLEDIGNPLSGKPKNNKNKGKRPSSSSRPRAGSLNTSLN
jgi:hypothetical protein